MCRHNRRYQQFFECIDHKRLLGVWQNLIGVKKLPSDQLAVFKAVTKYSEVDRLEAFIRLGFYGPKGQTSLGIIKHGYLRPPAAIPIQICTPLVFRQKISGDDGSKSLIERNYKNYGIPQGSPISDLLANVYLYDFDKIIHAEITSIGGFYYRYFDDILLVIPAEEDNGIKWIEKLSKLIKDQGEKLQIKMDKCTIHSFERISKGQKCQQIFGKSGKNGLEYLGFRFDGKNIYFRDSTFANLNRKIVKSAKRNCISFAKRHPTRTLDQLLETFPMEAFRKKFGKVEGFFELSGDKKHWTFWTYAARSSEHFGPRGRYLTRQLRNFEKNCAILVQKYMSVGIKVRERPPLLSL